MTQIHSYWCITAKEKGQKISNFHLSLVPKPEKFQVLKKTQHLKYYFQRHVCAFICRSVVRPSVKTLAPIPAGESQNVTNKSCSICLRGDKKALSPGVPGALKPIRAMDTF